MSTPRGHYSSIINNNHNCGDSDDEIAEGPGGLQHDSHALFDITHTVHQQQAADRISSVLVANNADGI